jgi:hypothetical protein
LIGDAQLRDGREQVTPRELRRVLEDREFRREQAIGGMEQRTPQPHGQADDDPGRHRGPGRPARLSPYDASLFSGNRDRHDDLL